MPMTRDCDNILVRVILFGTNMNFNGIINLLITVITFQSLPSQSYSHQGQALILYFLRVHYL